MSYRGPALQYKIRKTTVNNSTGDNFSITIPRFLAEQFSNCFFRITITGDNILFESGTKMTVTDIKPTNPNDKKVHIAGGTVVFR